MASAGTSWMRKANEERKSKKMLQSSNLKTERIKFKVLATCILAVDAKLLEEAMDIIKRGTALWKVKSFTTWYPRRYVFDVDNRRIEYEGSRKLLCPFPDSSEMINIKDVHDIRRGWRTDTFNKIARKVESRQRKKPGKKPDVDEKCCFSIVYGPDYRTLDLVCPTEEIRNAWVRGLTYWLAVQKNTEREHAFQGWLKQSFKNADLDKSGALDFEECVTLLHQLNVEMNKEYAKKLFDEANIVKSEGGEEVLHEDEFVLLYTLLKKRPELEELFLTHSVGAPLMGPNQLKTFLKQEQHWEDITLEDAADLIDVYEPSEARIDGFLSQEGFQTLLTSEAMDIFNITHRKLYQDMTQPLAHYYIASSHNTYLMGDQITGESSVEGYIRALKTGCRCVEMDVWDGADGEPRIYHGYTLTSKILLRDVLTNAIKPFAFFASEYPLIISLENHLSVSQQRVLAKHVNTILGNMLYLVPPSADMTQLPSPHDLRKKIIIKARKIPGSERGKAEPTGEDGSADTEKEVEDHKKSRELASELSDLVNICTAVTFKDFKKSKTDDKCYHMSSIVEGTALPLITTEPSDTIEHCRRQLLRIYPSGTRQGSSNYDPIVFWNVGVQIVALNYQTYSQPMTYNNALFHSNGHCGYILKPSYLLKGNFKPLQASTENGYLKTLSIKVISGQHIPKPRQKTRGEIVDPYVVILVRGGFQDDIVVQTDFVHNNGFNPQWNEKFVMQLKLPELCFVDFTVRDFSNTSKHEILGSYTIAFRDIKPGYRHIQLCDNFNKPIVPASIFVHISID